MSNEKLRTYCRWRFTGSVCVRPVSVDRRGVATSCDAAATRPRRAAVRAQGPGRRNLGWEPTRPVTLPESRTGRFFCRLYHGCDFLQTVSVGDDNTTRTMQTIVDTEHAASPRTPHCCLEDTTHATAATIVTLDSNFDSQWRMRIRLTGPFTARTTALYNSLLTA